MHKLERVFVSASVSLCYMVIRTLRGLMKNIKKFLLSGSVLLALLVVVLPVHANNLSISNITLGSRDASISSVEVKFDLSWENSWKTKINHDAVWLTVRLYNPTFSPTEKKLCQISASGLNASGTSVGSGASIEIYVPQDKYGAFVRPTSYGAVSVVSATDVQLTIDYSSCGFSATDEVYVSVFGLEMVYVPDGSFYAGDYAISSASLVQGSSDTDPWNVTSSSITVSNPASDGYRYVSAGNAGEDSTGSSFSISALYPNGYDDFYAMKYELTEGQWVEFINSLPSASARSNHDLTDTAHKNTDTVQNRNTISCSGSPLVCTTQREYRSLSYLSWMDLVAFLDWNALRPMTELEFEKVARGPVLSVEGEFAWGSAAITAAGAISVGVEDGSETITTASANTHYNNITLSGGDTPTGVDYATGPLRGGIFASSSSTREQAGAGYYGVMDLSGNLSERTITIGNLSGRNFTGTHGDGVLSLDSGYEGNATNADWPGIDATSSRGVTGADGSGFRGGSWLDQSSGNRLRVSDRNDAAKISTSAFNYSGGRGVRTYDGN